MASDPFELIARLLGVRREDIRRFSNDDEEIAPDDIPDLFGINVTWLSDLEELSERDLQDLSEQDEFTFDVDWSSASTSTSRPTRDGIGIRPGRRQPASSERRNNHRDGEKWACPSCPREFLTHDALQRHFDSNPSHSEIVVDVRDVQPPEDESRQLDDGDWVTFEDRIETFVALPEEIDEEELDATYDPSEEHVAITGPHEETVDTSAITDAISGELTWRAAGRHLVLSFPTQSNGSAERGQGESAS